MATRKLIAGNWKMNGSLSANEALPRSFDWTSTFGTTVMALFIGGTLCGLVLGSVIDFLYLLFWKIEHKQR